MVLISVAVGARGREFLAFPVPAKFIFRITIYFGSTKCDVFCDMLI